MLLNVNSQLPSKTITNGTDQRDSTARFPLIDALRGIAAIWVVLHHAFEGDHIKTLVEHLPRWLVFGCFESGRFGVAIFFVLSGFVITHSLRHSCVTPSFFGRFIARRSLRLDPPYFASIALVLAFAWVSAKVKHETMEWPSFPVLAAHAVYVQGLLELKQINAVYWTLCYEIQFYLVLCALIGLSQKVSSKRPQLIFVPVAIVSLVWGLGIRQENLVPGLFLNLWYAFLLGVFSYWAWSNKMRRIWFYIYAIGILASSLWRSDTFALICCGTSMLLLYGGGRNWLNWRWLQFLGTISYSLYLLHNPVTGACFFLLGKYFGSSAINETIMLIATLAACILAAYLMWRTVERPFMQLARRIQLDKGNCIPQ